MEKEFSKINQRGHSNQGFLLHVRPRLCFLLASFFSLWSPFFGSHSLLAQQTSSVQVSARQAVVNSASEKSQTSEGKFMNLGTEIAVGAVSVMTIGMLAYSLMSSGKNGWGWVTVCTIAIVLMVFVKLGASLFQEASKANSIADWDGD